MTNILLDVSRLIWRNSTGRMPTGIDRVCRAYLDHYGGGAQAVVQKEGLRRILSPALSAELFSLLRTGKANFKRQLGSIMARSMVQSPAIQHGNGRIYLNVGHTGLDQPGLKNWAERVNVRPVMLVADLIPISHPEFCRLGEKEKHELRMSNLLRAGAGVIGISQDTVQELTAFAMRSGLAMPPAIAAHLGVGGLMPESAVALPGDGRPYFVILGTIEGRKNHMLILNIWRELVRVRGVDAPMLLVIGQRGWECEQVVDMLERCESLRGHVVELSRVSDGDVTRYLRHAQALLFPSFVEGYGMPLVEALGIGTPVIASDLDVFHELVGTIPEYVSPIDGNGWMAAIENYATPESIRRRAQIARMVGYSPPRWDDHFSIVDTWLRSLESLCQQTEYL